MAATGWTADYPPLLVDDAFACAYKGRPSPDAPRTDPDDERVYRVAQPLLTFAPTEPTVRRYRSGLFRMDLRQIDHLCQA
jgi:hypothetical protein